MKIKILEACAFNGVHLDVGTELETGTNDVAGQEVHIVDDELRGLVQIGRAYILESSKNGRALKKPNTNAPTTTTTPPPPSSEKTGQTQEVQYTVRGLAVALGLLNDQGEPVIARAKEFLTSKGLTTSSMSGNTELDPAQFNEWVAEAAQGGGQ